MDLATLRKVHFRDPLHREWCICNADWPCPILAIYETSAIRVDRDTCPLPVAAVPIVLCTHAMTHEVTVFGDESIRKMCLRCNVEWSEFPASYKTPKKFAWLDPAADRVPRQDVTLSDWHEFDWEEGSGGYVHQVCTRCSKPRSEVEDKPCAPRLTESRLEQASRMVTYERDK